MTAAHADVVRKALDAMDDEGACACGDVYTCDHCHRRNGEVALDFLLARQDQLERGLGRALDQLEESREKGARLETAARAFDADLSEWCDGPLRDALRVALGEDETSRQQETAEA